MRYQIVAANSLPNLEKFVNNELHHGWYVTGGFISFSTAPLDKPPEQFFAQAMIKSSAPKPSEGGAP